MSKARLVVTPVVTEGRTQGEVAQAYGVGSLVALLRLLTVDGQAVSH
jgi:hypothetical protein